MGACKNRPGAWESHAHLGGRVAENPVAADHVTRGRSINDEDPVSVPAHIVSFDLVPAACTLKADPKIHIPVRRVHSSIPAESALANNVFVAAGEANAAAGRPLRTNRIVGPIVFLKVAVLDADSLHTTPTVISGSNVRHRHAGA